MEQRASRGCKSEAAVAAGLPPATPGGAIEPHGVPFLLGAAIRAASSPRALLQRSRQKHTTVTPTLPQASRFEQRLFCTRMWRAEAGGMVWWTAR